MQFLTGVGEPHMVIVGGGLAGLALASTPKQPERQMIHRGHQYGVLQRPDHRRPRHRRPDARSGRLQLRAALPGEGHGLVERKRVGQREFLCGEESQERKWQEHAALLVAKDVPSSHRAVRGWPARNRAGLSQMLYRAFLAPRVILDGGCLARPPSLSTQHLGHLPPSTRFRSAGHRRADRLAYHLHLPR